MKYYVADFDFFKENTAVFFDKEGHQILLAKLGEQVYAIANRCPHFGASLMKGTIEDGVVTCKSHGAKINLTNGEIIRDAKMGFIKFKTRRAKTYPVTIDNNRVYVEIE